MKKAMLISVLLLCSGQAQAMELPDADSKGARLFAARCSVCHALPHPKRLDWTHWRHMLRVMKRRMAERNITLPDEQWRRIAAY
ncbi:MAG: cytochrome c, partial [Zetaproteobacteria bacterium]